MSWRPLVALAAALPLLAGCSGTDARRAEQLLNAAQRAQQSLASETFNAHVRVSMKDQQFELQLSGGGYLKGAHAGDMVMDMRLTAPVTLPFTTMQVAKVGPTMWLSMDGRRQAIPVPAKASTQSADPLASFDFTRYVKDVKVEGGEVLDGHSVTKIVGVLDTASLLNGFAKLGGLTQMTGGQSLPGLGAHVGDTRVVLFLDDRTHLLTTALADLTVHTSQGDATIHFDVALLNVNRPVALPSA